MSRIQRVAAGFAIGFFLVVAVGYVPGFTDADGNLFGLFKIDPIDDVVHSVSAIAAALSAWHSPRAATLYLRIFGSLYGLDAVIGLITGFGDLDMATNIAVNLPHIIISSIALWAGFVKSREWSVRAEPAKVGSR